MEIYTMARIVKKQNNFFFSSQCLYETENNIENFPLQLNRPPSGHSSFGSQLLNVFSSVILEINMLLNLHRPLKYSILK